MLTKELSILSDELAKYTENGDGDVYCFQCSKEHSDTIYQQWLGLDPYYENDSGSTLICSECKKDILTLLDIDDHNAMIANINTMLDYYDQDYDRNDW